MGKNAVEAAEDVDKVLESRVLVMGVDNEAAGENLGVGYNIGGPV